MGPDTKQKDDSGFESGPVARTGMSKRRERSNEASMVLQCQDSSLCF